MGPSPRRRPPPPYQYGGARHHGGRRLLVLVLVLATVGAVGYLYLSRGGTSGGSTTDFVQVDRRFVAAAQAIPAAAQQVHRFAELHVFDMVAGAKIGVMSRALTNLQHIDAGASGGQKQVADQAVDAAQRAIYAAGVYKISVAYTYRLVDADSARQVLDDTVATLQQQITAWQHA